MPLIHQMDKSFVKDLFDVNSENFLKPKLPGSLEQKEKDFHEIAMEESELIRLGMAVEIEHLSLSYYIDSYLLEHNNDHSLDFYYYFMQVFVIWKTLFRQQMKYTDMFDFKQLRYIPNRNTTIVSNDKIFPNSKEKSI